MIFCSKFGLSMSAPVLPCSCMFWGVSMAVSRMGTLPAAHQPLLKVEIPQTWTSKVYTMMACMYPKIRGTGSNVLGEYHQGEAMCRMALDTGNLEGCRNSKLETATIMRHAVALPRNMDGQGARNSKFVSYMPTWHLFLTWSETPAGQGQQHSPTTKPRMHAVNEGCDRQASMKKMA